MSDQSSHDETRLAERIRAHLEASADALDDATVARLEEARRRAVAAAGRSARRGGWRSLLGERRPAEWLVPAGAFASVVATATALSIMVADPGDGVVREMDDLEMLTSGEDIELYENLEFYQWLQDRERAG